MHLNETKINLFCRFHQCNVSHAHRIEDFILIILREDKNPVLDHCPEIQNLTRLEMSTRILQRK